MNRTTARRIYRIYQKLLGKAITNAISESINPGRGNNVKAHRRHALQFIASDRLEAFVELSGYPISADEIRKEVKRRAV